MAQPEPQTGKPHAYNGYIPNKESKMNSTVTESVFSDLYDFVEVMNPDQEMCLDFCESQGITITEDVLTVIGDLLWNKEND